MGIGSCLKRMLGEQHVEDLRHQLKSGMDEGLERHVRIAVTGLSHSGKTVFISALAHHLLQAHQSRSLPFLGAAAEGRIMSVKELSAKELSVRDTRGSQPGKEPLPPFPLHSALEALNQQPPQWPPSTDGISAVRLAVRYQPGNRFKKLLTETSTLYVDLIDYPGEWLLDLPLLQLSFRDWCQQQRALFSEEPRASLGVEFCEQIAVIDWQQPVSDQTLVELSVSYNHFLQACRDEALSLLQPGRCVLPGDLAGGPLLQLFPLMQLPDTDQKIDPASGFAKMEQRYLDYREQVVRQFYRQHFSRFDRQVVLVDCLKTLNNGKACFDDMQRALSAVLQSFHYGQTSLLRRLFRPRIDRVLFAATKADHVTANQHHNLDKFLELLIEDTQRDLRFDGIDTECIALASIRATESAQAKLDGQQLSCLRGYDKHSGEQIALFPGEVPVELPTPEDWNSERFRFVDFAPCRLPQQQLRSGHHIRLDQALEYLLRDKL